MQSAEQQPGVNMGYHQTMTQIAIPTNDGFAATNKKDFSTVFPKQVSKTLAMMQLGMGAASLILQLILHIIIVIPFNALYSGYYCGPFFIIAGIFGVCAGEKPGYCSIISFMVFSILSSVIAIPLFSFSVLGLATPSCFSYTYSDESGYISKTCNAVISTKFANYFLAFLLLISIVEAITAIVSSAICCKAVCCCAPSFPMISANNTGLLQSGGNQFAIPAGFTQQQSALPNYGQQPSGFIQQQSALSNYGQEPSGCPVPHQQQAQFVANVHSPIQQMENSPFYTECSEYLPLTEKQ